MGERADALAEELGVTVVAPDMFRGQTSTFIPICIWLALSTPTERVNSDLEDVFRWREASGADGRLGVMGYCMGGGKAIRFTTSRRPSAATVICYGSPLIDVAELKKLAAAGSPGVCSSGAQTMPRFTTGWGMLSSSWRM